jgi:glutamate dehydrogenase (NAD(P)+)
MIVENRYSYWRNLTLSEESIMSDVFDYMDEFGPEEIICKYDPKTGMKGILVIDNTARGPGKGGCRMSANVTLSDVCRLARTMTWKWSMIDIFLGGAKAAIVNNPNAPNKEEIVRAWCKAFRNYIPDRYVFGLDMGLKEEDAAIVVDELGRRAAIGTPYELGGVSYDALGLTGFGIAEAAEVGCKYLNLDLKGATFSIQGFGAVGSFAAKYLNEKGATILGISSAEGAIYDPNGIDIERLLKLKEEFGDAATTHYDQGKVIPLGDELKVDADILIPGAVEDVITHDNINDIKARMIIEGANMATLPECQKILHEKGVFLIPDFIANAGAPMAGGLAMDGLYSVERPNINDAFEIIRKKMHDNVKLILDRVVSTKELPREVALVLAKERVVSAMRMMGRLPRK